MLNTIFDVVSIAALCLSVFNFLKARHIPEAKSISAPTAETPATETVAPVTSGHVRAVPNSYFAMRGRR